MRGKNRPIDTQNINKQRENKQIDREQEKERGNKWMANYERRKFGSRREKMAGRERGRRGNKHEGRGRKEGRPSLTNRRRKGSGK